MKVKTTITDGTPARNEVRSLEVEYHFGSNLTEAVKLFGEGVVFDNFVDNAVIGLQAFIRGKLKKTGDDHITDAAIIDAVKEWKPSNRKPADPAKKAATITKALAGMTREQREAILAALREDVKEAAPAPALRKANAKK